MEGLLKSGTFSTYCTTLHKIQEQAEQSMVIKVRVAVTFGRGQGVCRGF